MLYQLAATTWPSIGFHDDEADGWAASPPAPTARGIGTCKPPSRLSVSTIAQDFFGADSDGQLSGGT